MWRDTRSHEVTVFRHTIGYRNSFLPWRWGNLATTYHSKPTFPLSHPHPPVPFFILSIPGYQLSSFRPYTPRYKKQFSLLLPWRWRRHIAPYRKPRGISWLADNLLASQEGLCAVELAISRVSKLYTATGYTRYCALICGPHVGQ